MVKPSVTELLKKATNRYELVIATSKRARQIVDQRNAEKKLEKESSSKDKKMDESAVTTAAEEIAEGKVKIEAKDEEE
ncbi:MAG: DNA-directed RNA polymerase subunit omega [Clostridia bacterium]|nr:DNA-directed RNA polymerase subunit omega [Clostridia bacterium]